VFECRMLSCGWFPGIWSVYASVSEHCPIFIPTHLWTWNRHCSETLAFKQQMPVNHTYLLAYENGTDVVPKRWHLNYRHQWITYLLAYEGLTDMVPKRWHLNYRRRWITHTYLPMKMEHTWFLKRWHLNYRRRWITHTYLPMKMEQTWFRNVDI
jgi:hypothetical protein